MIGRESGLWRTDNKYNYGSWSSLFSDAAMSSPISKLSLGKDMTILTARFCALDLTF